MMLIVFAAGLFIGVFAACLCSVAKISDLIYDNMELTSRIKELEEELQNVHIH